jgi:hypothetical protein
MPLSTNFTDTEVEYIREICRIPRTSDNISILVGKLDDLNAAEKLATQRDIAQFQSIEYGTEKSKGGIKGTDYDTERNRQYIRNKVRERLDYELLADAIGANEIGLFSIQMPSYFGSSDDEYSQN